MAWPAVPFALLAAGLTVDSLSPDALCPPLEETRAAVAARLGSVELEGTWHASYLLVHRTEGDFVALSLRDPAGTLRLERDLPVQSGSCATLSRVIALVLERFFLRPERGSPDDTTVADKVAATQAHTQAEPAPPPGPAPDLPAPAAPRPAMLSDQTSPAVTSGSRPRSRLSAAFWASTAWVAPEISFETELGGPYRLGLGVAFDLARHETRTFEGAANSRRAPLSLSCERRFASWPGIQAEAGLDLLGVLESAQTTALLETGGGLRLVPGLGARLGASFLTGGPAHPFAALTAAWLLRAAAPAFHVKGQEVLPPPTLVLGLAVGVSTPF